MKKFQLHTLYRKRLADTVTPVSIYLRLRDRFANSIMLESSDYHGHENNYSFICCDPIARFELSKQEITLQFPNGELEKRPLQHPGTVLDSLQEFVSAFEIEALPMRFSYCGLFGYHSYDAIRYYEDISIQDYQDEERAIPDMLYQLYRFVIVVNHHNNELFMLEHQWGDKPSMLDYIERLLTNPTLATYPFRKEGNENSTLSDEGYIQMVRHGIDHCKRGDVFQIVLSRPFNQAFTGDEFNVYRALRSVNPSPYLFYCDFGGFKLLGSSPEAQLVVHKGKAEIHPIAGTFRRTGNDEEDTEQARKLFADPKENAEHIMLVDLARNDLSRHGKEVKVDTFKEIQYYSHVIHLVSKVTAELEAGASSLQLVADTFPAGTLSGAPKHMAMQLINRYEAQNRGFYGGCIGYLGFDGTFNHAIMIRSFLSKGNRLYFQAGAGVVFKSQPESELQEVNNKLGALRRAMEMAETII